MDWQEQLNQQLHDLPAQPGVYLMHDKDGAVIYVGKATSLKQRVRSYFHQGAKENPKTASLVERIHSLEVMVVPSPVEALLLESNLIKKYHPRYNVRLMDDKHYPYLKVSLAEDFPRLSVARAVKEDGTRYFGPYTSSAAMHTTEKLIREIFPLRTCGNGDFLSRKRPCLNYQIKRCAAPCTGEISREDYRFMVEQVVLFLEGRTNDMVKRLRREWRKLAVICVLRMPPACGINCGPWSWCKNSSRWIRAAGKTVMSGGWPWRGTNVWLRYFSSGRASSAGGSILLW